MILSVGCATALGCAVEEDDVDESDSNLTENDLQGKEFIHKGTFANAGSGSYPRDGVELEGITNFSCTGGPKLLELLRAKRGERTTYQRLRRAESMEAFTTEYAIDEMPWGDGAHEIREASPFVWLTVEQGRFEVDAESGRRSLSVGTDIMDDTYYDSPDYILADAKMTLRGRARWDTPTQIRRLLIGAKIDSSVDVFGIKSANKHDIRIESASAAQITGLDRDIRRGFTSWGGSDRPADPVRNVYERLSKANKLPDVTKADGTVLEDVLLLEPKAHLRSVRSRFHLEEATITSVTNIFRLGETRLQAVLQRIDEARRAGVSLGSDVTAFESRAKGYLDGSLLAQRVGQAVKDLDAQADITPTGIAALRPGVAVSGMTISVTDLEKRRIVAEGSSALIHEIARDLEAARGSIARAGATTAPHVDRFRAWINSAPNALLGTNVAQTKILTTLDRFVEFHARMVALPSTDKTAQLTAYNRYGNEQKAAGTDAFRDFTDLDDAGLTALGDNLEDAQMRIWVRQLEASGSAGIGMWFDLARQHYVPSSARVTSNFIIDTMDMTEMTTHEAWEGIPLAERTADKVIPADKIFGAVLVNELQIELGSEKAYTSRLAELGAQPESAERNAKIEGAKFVFGKYQEMLTKLSQLKAPDIVRRLQDAGGQGCTGKDAEASKGDQAIKQVRGNR